MPKVIVSSEVADRLDLLGRAWATNDDQTVRRLIAEFQNSQRGDVPAPQGSIGIHALYNGQRIEATFDPDTRRVQILSGPLESKTFNSPSGAAIAVVQRLKPKVHPNRNGWTFWTLNSNGEMLQSMRHA